MIGVRFNGVALWVLFVLLFAFQGFSAEREPIPWLDFERVWTDARGNEIEALLLSFDDEEVELEILESGKKIDLPFAKLSDRDQEYVTTYIELVDHYGLDDDDFFLKVGLVVMSYIALGVLLGVFPVYIVAKMFGHSSWGCAFSVYFRILLYFLIAGALVGILAFILLVSGISGPAGIMVLIFLFILFSLIYIPAQAASVYDVGWGTGFVILFLSRIVQIVFELMLGLYVNFSTPLGAWIDRGGDLWIQLESLM